jgi:uncharacterized protein YjbI with pentapeptide repeats
MHERRNGVETGQIPPSRSIARLGVSTFGEGLPLRAPRLRMRGREVTTRPAHFQVSAQTQVRCFVVLRWPARSHEVCFRARQATACGVAVCVFFGGAALWSPRAWGQPPPAQPTAEVPPTATDLEQEKLTQEIRHLRLENRDHEGFRGFVTAYVGSLPAFAAVLTGLAAVIGLGLTARQAVHDRARQEAQALEESVRDRVQREIESRRVLDERFAAILMNLGAETEPIRAGAAVSLFTFLRRENSAYHSQVRLAALANLKVEHTPAVTRILVGVMERALRVSVPRRTAERDFSQAQMPRIDLSGLDLSGADLAFTNLRGANLTDASLRRAEGFSVVLEKARMCGTQANLEAVRFQAAKCAGALFHDARLVAAHFEDAVLTGAQFQRAKLQAAHLEGADLNGAQFQGAMLKDAYFFNRKSGRKAALDDTALATITRAHDWEQAHFCRDHKARLYELSSSR